MVSESLKRSLTPAGLVCISLSLLGCLAIYNATFHLERPFEYVGRQLVWLVVAVVTLMLTSAASRADYGRLLPWVAGVGYALLWLVLAFGIRVNGMRGWFAWRGVFLQPSELTKPIFVLCLAWVIERTGSQRESWRRGYLPALAVLLAWTVPIALQPDFGAVLVYALTFVLVYACMNGPLRHLLVTGLAALPVLITTVATTPYLRDRWLGFVAPEQHLETAGWHIVQFQRTLASGGIFGHAFGKAVWSQNYLPFGYSDSIFATIGESIGLFGLLPFILLILAWVLYGYRKAHGSRDLWVMGTVLGMVCMIAGQAFVHLSVNLGLCPPTGITLPLISYGGSSLVATLASVGIVEGLTRSEREAER